MRLRNDESASHARSARGSALFTAALLADDVLEKLVAIRAVRFGECTGHPINAQLGLIAQEVAVDGASTNSSE